MTNLQLLSCLRRRKVQSPAANSEIVPNHSLETLCHPRQNISRPGCLLLFCSPQPPHFSGTDLGFLHFNDLQVYEFRKTSQFCEGMRDFIHLRVELSLNSYTFRCMNRWRKNSLVWPSQTFPFSSTPRSSNSAPGRPKGPWSLSPYLHAGSCQAKSLPRRRLTAAACAGFRARLCSSSGSLLRS